MPSTAHHGKTQHSVETLRDFVGENGKAAPAFHRIALIGLRRRQRQGRRDFGLLDDDSARESRDSMHQAVTHVPATTANLGPGYDCLGIALALGNRVTVERLDSSPRAAGMPAQAAERFFAAAAVKPFPFAWSIAGDVPRSRGMGSASPCASDCCTG